MLVSPTEAKHSTWRKITLPGKQLHAGSLSRTASMSALRFLLKSGSESSASRIKDMICVESMAGLDSLFAK